MNTYIQHLTTFNRTRVRLAEQTTSNHDKCTQTQQLWCKKKHMLAVNKEITVLNN